MGKFYGELSSLVEELDISGKALYTASNSIYKHYHPVTIPKKNGESRQLYVPDEFMKSIQRRISERLLSKEEVSSFAMAYVPGGSTKSNASPHVGQPMILKLDIRHFFDRLSYPLVKEKAFPKERYSESNRVLLSVLCVYMDALPQGAPTSPIISNIILREFDNKVGNWCLERDVVYTRYCDDMTFSGDFDAKEVITFVKKELKEMGLFLNNKKTVIAGKGQKHIVTGIVVNEKMSLPKAYKRQIRQELHYCIKYGVESHLKASKINETPQGYISKLLGRINYVLSVEPENVEMREYSKWINERMSL